MLSKVFGASSSRLTVAQAASEMSSMSWNGPWIKSDISWLLPQDLCHYLSIFVRQALQEFQSFVVVLVFTFLFWQPAEYCVIDSGTWEWRFYGETVWLFHVQWVAWVLSSAVMLCCQFKQSNLSSWQQPRLFGEFHRTYISLKYMKPRPGTKSFIWYKEVISWVSVSFIICILH